MGRGCLAGPVVAGAVVLDPDCHIPGLSDSKQVPAAERERLYDAIVRRALGWSVALAEPDEIDTDQHPPGVAAGHAPLGARRSRRCPTWCWSTRSASRICYGAARRGAR